MPKKNGNENVPKHLRKMPQPHGGALNGGGTPGNKGGTGRPSNEARRLAALALVEGVPRLKALMDNKKDPHNQVNAFNALAKLLPQQIGEDPEAPFLTEAERRARLKSLLG